MDVAIRQITEDDIQPFYDTFATVVRERQYLAFLEPPPIGQTAAFVRNNIAKRYPHLVALSDGNVAGWCDITPPGREVSAHVGVLGIALHPAWRGQRLGERLAREALAAADAYGYTRVELSLIASNTRALALYRKLGFIEEGLRRRRLLIDGIHHDEILMARLRDTA